MSSKTASKREQARLDAQRAKDRQARNARLAAGGALALVAAAAVGLVLAQQGDDPTTTTQARGGLLTTAPPWPAQADGLAERVAQFGFPPVGDESYHAHALLTVYRDGQQVPVPDDLGYDTRGAHSRCTRTPRTASSTWKPTTPTPTPLPRS
jgi:hypothetical protein